MHQNDSYDVPSADFLRQAFNDGILKAVEASEKERARLEKENAKLRADLESLESSIDTRHYKVQVVGKVQVPGIPVDGYRIETDNGGMKYIVAIQGTSDKELLEKVSDMTNIVTVFMPPGTELCVTELVRK